MNLEKRKEKFEDFYYNDIGMCGCGRPKDVMHFLFCLLENHRKYKDDEITYEVMYEKRKEIIKSVDSDVIFEVIFHVFEKAKLLEHGNSVYGSYFTKDGLTFLNLLSEFKHEY